MIFQYGNQVLDFCVLAILEHQDSYGYEITQRILETIEISESTMYPVLRRLKKYNHLETYDVPYQGRNRRYYKITDSGKELLELYKSDWEIYKDKIDYIVKGEEDE
ncbi:PadR family transcriptional regulator [Miniphocaeibacter halophilus]|uniref:PadR family transcriptional regulator n=1 Tax=Miniphocaeibacter halophilus TaxID=2931922 RepID=A0AC61MT04_9FIRM|nr:PadR family transcriptional regulator [Miniphocaeibacter halophilus]QQK07949.1 PadR family transcriptional regulator [Miniphocaeibacter halophilus]